MRKRQGLVKLEKNNKESRMNYKNPLITGRIKGLYKDLILDVELENGDIVQALCPESNFKNMLYKNEITAYLTQSQDTRRRVGYICQMIDKGDGLVFINYKYKNILFIEGFAHGIMAEDFGGYNHIREIRNDDEELKHVNFELRDDNNSKAYVYVANIYNKQGTEIVFPSTINFFELEMLEELRRMRYNGHESYICLIVPREDCMDARFVWNQNPIAAAKLYEEIKNGLKLCCYSCNVNEKSVSITKKMRILY